MKGMWHSWWVRVSVIAGFGLLLRLAYVIGMTRFDEPVGDQLYYSAQALTNARGEWFEQPFAQGMPAADHPPLTSFILTPITWLTESSGSFVTAQRLMMVLIGVVSIVLMALIGRLLAGEFAGLCAAGITAVYANVWTNDGLVMAETPTFLLIAFATLTALMYRRQPKFKYLVCLGMTAGLLALTRPEMALITVLLMGFVFSVHHKKLNLADCSKKVAVVAVVSMMVVGPWILWNQARFAEPVFLSTNDGLTFAGANCDQTYFDDVGGWDIWCAYETEIPDDADASQASALMREDGLSYWRSHLDRYPIVAAARIARVLSIGFIGSNNNAASSEGRATWISMVGVIQFWMISLVAFIGWGATTDRADRWLLLALLPTILCVAMVANAYVRFRLPAEVGLITLASIGLNQLIKVKQKPKASSASM